MIKYGISKEQTDELVKLGVCKTLEEAREAVSAGKADELIKTARAEKEETGGG